MKAFVLRILITVKLKMGFKQFIRTIIDHTPFRPVHIGYYIRNLYFKKYLRKLPREKIKKILDAGCSNGSYALELAERFPQFEIVAVDINERHFPESHPPNLVFKQQNLMTLEETSVYDFIYSIDVLEHIKGNLTVIKNLSSALKSGGYLFIHIPNDKDNKRIFPGRFFKEFDQWATEEHIGEQYTTTELSRILENLGFRIIAAEYTFGFPGQLAWEIDRICDRSFKLKIFFMPFLKLLARIAPWMPHRKGSTLVLAEKN